MSIQFSPNIKKSDLMQEIRLAFREYLITGGAGVGIPKKAVDAYWEIFNGSLEWRIDKLYDQMSKSKLQE